MISLDTETTGIDLKHGAKPFFVTICREDGDISYWEWPVNPVTREPEIPSEDLAEIRELVQSNELVLQNAKFDVAALDAIGLNIEWPWFATHDTLPMGHVLASNQPHDLTSMAMRYLGRDISTHEELLKTACNAARRLARSQFPSWRIASRNLPDMPSAKETPWRYDYWLPRALARALKYKQPDPKCKHSWDAKWLCETCRGHFWWIALSNYANEDSGTTLALYKVMSQELKLRDLWGIYEVKRKLGVIAYRMEANGLTLSRENLDTIQSEYARESQNCKAICQNIANNYVKHCPKCNFDLYNFRFLEAIRAGTTKEAQIENALIYSDFTEENHGAPGVKRAGRIRKVIANHGSISDTIHCSACNNTGEVQVNLTLPKGGVNNSLRSFLFDTLQLPILKVGKRGQTPSIDKAVLEEWESSLPETSKARAFIRNLRASRKRDTALQYMEGYKRYWQPLNIFNSRGEQLWYRLYPSINPNGTDTLRWSSQNPNEQNISKQEGFNLRYCFGPAPGREWWSLDYKNIERRIPIYEANDEDGISLFEHPDDPPYYGSEHLLVAHLLRPKLFEECRDERGEVDGRIFKKRYAATYYQWIKNGNFAIQYGCQRAKADTTYHLDGAYDIIKKRFWKQEELNQYWINYANKYGYVETIPDKTVNPKHGYPIMCTRTEYGKVLPTVPLNYHVSGSAMWISGMAMIYCQEKLDEWYDLEGFDGAIVIQCHDELVFDFPKGGDPIAGPMVAEQESNLWRVKILQQLMEQAGENLSIPAPTGLEYHADNWSHGVSI